MSNCDDMTHFVAVIGGVGEWFKPPVLKTGDLERGPRVRISPPPQNIIIINLYTKKAGQGYSIEYPFTVSIPTCSNRILTICNFPL